MIIEMPTVDFTSSTFDLEELGNGRRRPPPKVAPSPKIDKSEPEKVNKSHAKSSEA
jgi:hypothetical protein